MCYFRGRDDEKIVNIVCWCCISVLFLLFVGAMATNSSFVFKNYDFISNATYVNNSGQQIICRNPALPFGLAIVSYALLILFCLFCCFATRDCFLVCSDCAD